MRGHIEDPGNVRHLVFSAFDKLGIDGINGNFLELHTLFQHRHRRGILQPAVQILPLLSQALDRARVVRFVRLTLERFRMFQDAGQQAATAEQLGPELLLCQTQPDGFPMQGNG